MLLLWSFTILDSIFFLNIGFILCRAIVFTGISIINIAIPVKPNLRVRNAFRCAIFISFDWMTVESSDSADI